MEVDRPGPITIISIFCILGGAISLATLLFSSYIATALAQGFFSSAVFLVAFSIITSVLQILIGIEIHRGKNWTRYGLLTLLIIAFLVEAVGLNYLMLILRAGIIWFCFYFLFLDPKAKVFFKKVSGPVS